MSSRTSQPVNVLLVGGCGHWAAAENHLPAIRTLQKRGFPVRVAAICDPRNPYEPALRRHMPYLDEVVTRDRPAWIKPQPGQSAATLECRLQQAHHEHRFDVVIVACDPVGHLPYLKWATQQGIHVLCDKPIICVEDAAWKPESAAQIRREFDSLLDAHRAVPGHLFAVPLRRRANDAFVYAGELLQDVYNTHQQSLTAGRIDVCGGHFRLPEEYALGNAHGYTHGVGALSFSSYHYLDEMTRYLLLAPGRVTDLRLTLQYVRRVGDHLASGINDVLGTLLQPHHEAELPDVQLSERITLAEMDFAFTVELLNGHQHLGVLTYSFTSNSLSNRAVGVLACDAGDIVAFREKGRMSQFVIDLHQGNLQHVRLSKNDAVGEPYRIRLEHRRNPLIGGTKRLETLYENAHDGSAITPQDITAAFITMAAGAASEPAVTNKIAFLEGQALTHRIFAAMYELVATHHHSQRPCPSMHIQLP